MLAQTETGAFKWVAASQNFCNGMMAEEMYADARLLLKLAMDNSEVFNELAEDMFEQVCAMGSRSMNSRRQGCDCAFIQ